MLRLKGMRILLVIVLLALFLQAYAGQSATPEVPELGKIQVGYILILGFAPFFVAVEKGYFEEQGLDVEL